ncbi:hypothetical protein Ana3638_11990 [Anaerocolumna sedimenticola]|uniref:BIG2 domain-containing protein n=1 Tax=Anaerocolumna sedimenticola TaxID=2696063 RepID=A0A6P1TNM0_9FIRM|nr:Ig-like domain-containing protein [Anaerocolumna sedimenticola]QHQ61406.1 hypothetical protein Ana3638_11990 [Anaerocolumna sedimenticola]
MKKFLSVLMTFIILIALAAPVQTANAATIKLNKSKATILVGSSVTLKLTGTTKAAKWSTSNKKIATVSTKGVVKGMKKGTANITAAINGKKYTCKITVNEKTVTVTVTNMLNNDAITKYLGTIKFSKTKLNDDYTTTYTMTTVQQKDILNFLTENFKTSLSDNLLPYYEAITVNKDFTYFVSTVDKNEYQKNVENDPTALGLFIWSSGYQQFNGIKDADIKFLIDIVDKDTGKKFDTINLSDIE